MKSSDNISLRRICQWIAAGVILSLCGVGLFLSEAGAQSLDSYVLEIPGSDQTFRLVIPRRHPRLYLKSSDLDALRQKRNDPLFANEWANIKFGEVEPISNALHSLIEPGAIDRASQLDKCDLAIRQSQALLEKDPADDRNLDFLFLQNVHRAAIVYDWCYERLSEELRSTFIRQFKRLAAAPGALGFPAPKDAPSLVGHEAQGSLLGSQLAVGLALLDEDPSIFEAAAKIALTQYRRASEFLFPGITDLQGVYYARHEHFIMANWLFRKLGLNDAFNASLARMPYEWIYGLRSDGRMVRSGDLVDDNNISKMYRFVFSAIGSYYDDPLLVWMGDTDYRDNPVNQWRSTKWAQLLPLTPDMYALRYVFLSSELRRKALLEGRTLLERLPLALYAPSPAGRILFRTGWSSVTDGISSHDAIIDMKIGEYFIGNHQRKDFGTFQLYFRGPLAISSGVYQGSENSWYGGDHWVNYYHQTVSSNGLLIFDPNEHQFLYGERANDGGQIWPNRGKDHPRNIAEILDPSRGYHMARVTSHLIAEDQSFAYIAGDLTEAYSSSKVSRVERAMVAIRTNQSDVPVLFIVKDSIRSKQSGLEKIFLLHSADKPTVSGRTIVISNIRHSYDKPLNRGRFSGEYAGRLIVKSLLPEDATIRFVEGHTIRGRSFQAEKPESNGEGGWGRTEVVSSKSDETNFLTAMFATDASNEANSQIEKIASRDFIGCKGFDKTILFNRERGLLNHQTSLTIDTKWVFLGAIAPGKWELTNTESGSIHELFVGKDAQSIQLDTPIPGGYVLRPVSIDQ